MLSRPILTLVVLVPSLLVSAMARAETYDVGPGLTYENIGDVPLGTLAAGDVVEIHWRAEPYRPCAARLPRLASCTVARPRLRHAEALARDGKRVRLARPLLRRTLGRVRLAKRRPIPVLCRNRIAH